MYTSAIAAVAAVLLRQALASPLPLVVSPGAPTSVVITSQNTLNGTLVGTNTTSIGNSTSSPNSVAFDSGRIEASTAGNANLGLMFQNNFSGGSINVYINGYDDNNAIAFVLADGSYYYPPATTSAVPVEIIQDLSIPISGTVSLKMPGYLSSGRIWVADSDLVFSVVDAGGVQGIVQPSSTNPDDPSAGCNWGFVEFTNNDVGIYADVSFVDFVGMPLGLSLQSSDGTQVVQGVVANAVEAVCTALQAQAAIDGAPWGELCVTDSSGTILRVIAPGDYISLEPTAFQDYWTSYVNDVYTYYETNTLTIDTQAAAGQVACTVVNNEFSCEGDSGTYPKPAANDIFGCNSGPFIVLPSDNDIHAAVVPRLCAAFDRSTLLISGGNSTPGLPSESYYTVSPTNYFSKFVHENEVGGLGYAFAYDDVTPDGAPSAAGLVSDANPETLTVIIGGPASSS
jgi:hypothetical protein